MNENLKQRIEDVFKPLGIIGYSGCCRLGCTGAYDETDRNFRLRDKGIIYFKLFLSGMNYYQDVRVVYVQYSDIGYLHGNWEQEKGHIDRWCGLLGLHNGEYEIERPETEEMAITVRFNRALGLDAEQYDDDDDEDRNVP